LWLLKIIIQNRNGSKPGSRQYKRNTVSPMGVPAAFKVIYFIF